MRLLLLGLLACQADPVDDKSVEVGSDSEISVETDGPVDSDVDSDVPLVETDEPDIVEPPPLPWSDDPCSGVSTSISLYRDYVDRMVERDDATPPPAGGLVVTGSSSIRRWETAFSDLASYGVIQRGFGGARITEVAEFAEELITRHDPAGVLLFAGTNDLAFLRPVDEVVDSWRCIVQKVFDANGPTPVVFIGITPTPSRWLGWPRAREANETIAAIAEQHPLLDVVDLATPFLATGMPPDARLFVSDRLHLSEEGYALWSDAVVPVAATAFTERAPVSGGLASGQRVRMDLGPGLEADVVDVDDYGLHWNHWHRDGQDWLAGEARRGLVTTTGDATGMDFVVTGGFDVSRGGLATPPASLDTMSVAQATADYAVTSDADAPGGLALTGLDPTNTYTLRLFASVGSDGSTVYRVWGGSPAVEQELAVGGNTDVVAVFEGLSPDAWGQLHVDVRAGTGGAGHLALLEIEGE